MEPPRAASTAAVWSMDMASNLDGMGPRFDIRPEPPEPGLGGGRPGPSPTIPYRPSSSTGGSGGRLLAGLGLAVAVIALAVAIFGLVSTPEPVPGPLPSPDVVMGGTAERVAKLEKDVSSLMLRLVTLEKELEAVRGRAGAITKLTELNVKVQALQERLDGLGARPAPRAPAAQQVEEAPVRPASKPEPKPEAKPAPPKPEPKPAAKAPVAEDGDEARKSKQIYTVRRGDTLFTVAQRYDVSMKDIMRWNDLKQGEAIKVDQKLVIYK